MPIDLRAGLAILASRAGTAATTATAQPPANPRKPHVKLQADRIEGRNAIARHSTEGVIINGQAYTHSLIVPWSGEPQAWTPSAMDALLPEHFDALVALGPQLVIFGSGARLRFPPPRLLAGLMRARIGLETMDTPAACRTYNVLLAEGRAVVAALLFN